jgi:hydrogenase maturation factor HypF (carbamoyltransferase family)
MKSYRNDTRYVRQREVLKRRYQAQGLACASCGNPFLWEFEDRKLYPDFWKDARSFTADHIEAVNMGGRMAPGVDGLQGMHRACNSSKGDGSKTMRARPPQNPPPLRTSREW